MNTAIRFLNLTGIVLALGWLAFSLAALFWMLMAEPGADAATAGIAAETLRPLTVPMEQSQNLHSVDKIALFRSRVAALSPDSQGNLDQLANTAATSLNLVLDAAIASNDSNRARAVISNANERVSLSPGDTLPFGLQGVRLVSVGTSKVILDNGGRFETLWMYEPTLARRVPAATDDINDIETVMTDEAAVQPVLNHDSEYGRTANVNSLSDLISLAMYRERGMPVGLQVKPNGDPGLFHRAGLLSGDVVVAVNGQKLDSIASIEDAARELASATDIKLDIQRQGLVMPVRIDLTQLQL